MPTVGFLSTLTNKSTVTNKGFGHLLAAFEDQLSRELSSSWKLRTPSDDTVPKDLGANEVFICTRWTDGQYGTQLSTAADQLAKINPPPTVIAATGGVTSAKAAQSKTGNIPILFLSGRTKSQEHDDHSANARGIWLDNTKYAVEHVDRHRKLRDVFGFANDAIFNLVHDLPQVFDDEKDWTNTVVVKGGNFAAAFDEIMRKGARVQALTVSADSHFTTHYDGIVNFANTKFKKPVSYPFREYVEQGGLMSCGPSLTEAYRALGSWAAGIINSNFTFKDLGKLQDKALARPRLVVNQAAARAQLGAAKADELIRAADDLI